MLQREWTGNLALSTISCRRITCKLPPALISKQVPDMRRPTPGTFRTPQHLLGPGRNGARIGQERPTLPDIFISFHGWTCVGSPGGRPTGQNMM